MKGSKCKYYKQYKNYHSYRRNVLLSLANPMYICLIEDDPILASFKLCRSLKRESEIDSEYAKTYNELIERVRNFVVSLVSECRDSTETAILLSQSKGYSNFGMTFELPRLQLAIEYKEKSFIAAPPVQCLILEKYYEHRQSWNWKPFYSKLFIWFTHLVVLPYVAIVRAFIPSHIFVHYYTTPHSKVIFRFCSLVFFNIILFLLIYLDMDRKKEGPPETGLEWIVIIWIAGLIRETVKKVCLLGLKRCFQRFWIMYEIVLEIFFIITFIFWARAAVEAAEDEIKGEDKKEIDRSEWNEFNATLIHEASFAMGTFLSVFLLFYYAQISSTLGPWQVSIIKMGKQIYIALTFAMVLLFPIAMILTSLYHNYSGNRQMTKSGDILIQPIGFTSLFNSIYTLFWTMLSTANPNMANVVTNTTQTNAEPKNHWIAKMTGYFLYTFFCILMQIGMINVLIAVISNKFREVIKNAEIEWKMARTSLILNHIQETTDMPPPFNLIIGLPDLKSILELIKALSGKGKELTVQMSKKGFGYKREEDEIDREIEYKVGRYLNTS